MRIELVDTDFYIATLHYLCSGLIEGIHLTACINIPLYFALFCVQTHLFHSVEKMKFYVKCFAHIQFWSKREKLCIAVPLLLFLFSFSLSVCLHRFYYCHSVQRWGKTNTRHVHHVCVWVSAIFSNKYVQMVVIFNHKPSFCGVIFPLRATANAKTESRINGRDITMLSGSFMVFLW